MILWRRSFYFYYKLPTSFEARIRCGFTETLVFSSPFLAHDSVVDPAFRPQINATMHGSSLMTTYSTPCPHHSQGLQICAPGKKVEQPVKSKRGWSSQVQYNSLEVPHHTPPRRTTITQHPTDLANPPHGFCGGTNDVSQFDAKNTHKARNTPRCRRCFIVLCGPSLPRSNRVQYPWLCWVGNVDVRGSRLSSG